MSKLVKFFLLIMTLLLAAACSSEPKQTQPVTTKTDSGTSTAPPAKEAEQRDNALVRVINTVPGSGSFDISADDQKVFESVAFKSVTPYKELSDDRHSFGVRPAGQATAQPVAEISKDLIGGKHYTIVVMPDTNDKTAVDLVNDNITDPPADKALVRVIHASTDAGDVDVVNKQGAKKLFSRLNFQKGTSYMVLDPIRTTLEIRQQGQDKPIDSGECEFRPDEPQLNCTQGRKKQIRAINAMLMVTRLLSIRLFLRFFSEPIDRPD